MLYESVIAMVKKNAPASSQREGNHIKNITYKKSRGFFEVGRLFNIPPHARIKVVAIV